MESNKQYISSHCVIESNRITVNNNLFFEADGLPFDEFAKQAYHHAETDYPKFFKMDNLSKLSFMAAELLLKDAVTENEENNIALLFANNSSSLDTDVKFQNSITDKSNYYPSPSVFVYTLPNICLGEISIRYRLFTENSFFIFENFSPEFFTSYAGVMLLINKAERILCGWVEFYKEDYKAFMYLVSNEGTIEHTAENIENLYNT